MNQPIRTLSWCTILSLLATSGCATLPLGIPGFGPGEEEVAQQLPPHVPAATVVMVEDSAEPVAAQLPLEEVTYIQGALEKTGLDNRFRRMTIELIRPLESGRHKISIPYDRVNRGVAPEYDYALQPGDKLVVTEDTSTVLDDMLNSITPF